MKPGSFLIPIIIVTITSLVIFSCSKSGSGTKPTFSLTSIDKTTIGPNDSLIVHFKFTNGSSVQNGSFVSILDRLNEVPPLDGETVADTLRNPIPDLEGASKGEFRYALAHSSIYQSTSLGLNDTIVMKFFVLSSSGVSSDTISSEKLIVLK
jgi:hypothetical protein